MIVARGLGAGRSGSLVVGGYGRVFVSSVLLLALSVEANANTDIRLVGSLRSDLDAEASSVAEITLAGWLRSVFEVEVTAEALLDLELVVPFSLAGRLGLSIASAELILTMSRC